MHLVGVGHLKNLPKDPFCFWEKDPILKAAMLEVMTFVNQIAEIVHGVVDECWGAVNKNDGHLDINRRMLQFLITELILENISQKVPFHLTMKSLIRGDSFLIIWRLADLTSADVCLPPSSHSAGLPPSFFTVTFSFNLVAALNWDGMMIGYDSMGWPSWIVRVVTFGIIVTSTCISRHLAIPESLKRIWGLQQ